jgi:hypothetical protein
MDRTCGTHEANTQFHSVNPRGRNHLGELGKDGRMILNFVLKKQNAAVAVGLNWLRIGYSDSFVITVMIFRFQ